MKSVRFLRVVLACGNFRLIYDKDQETLWLGGDGRKPKDQETFEISGPIELFGFGSGEFGEGPTAKDVMSDVQGRWLGYKVQAPSEECILEPDRRLPEHVRNSDIFGKAWQLYLLWCVCSLRDGIVCVSCKGY